MSVQRSCKARALQIWKNLKAFMYCSKNGGKRVVRTERDSLIGHYGYAFYITLRPAPGNKTMKWNLYRYIQTDDAWCASVSRIAESRGGSLWFRTSIHIYILTWSLLLLLKRLFWLAREECGAVIAFKNSVVCFTVFYMICAGTLAFFEMTPLLETIYNFHSGVYEYLLPIQQIDLWTVNSRTSYVATYAWDLVGSMFLKAFSCLWKTCT